MKRIRTILGVAGMAAVAAPLVAQQPAPRNGTERVGYIVAVVGDSAVLNFDLDQGLLARQAQLRQPVPEPGPARDALLRDVLDDRITELLLLQAALRDTTIRVQDDQITRAVQAEIEARQREVGGAVQFEQAVRASGLTMQAYRDMLAQQQRRGALIQQYLQRTRQTRTAPPVTENDIRQLYESARGSFEERPATVTLQQIAVNTEPSAEAVSRTRAKADSIYMRVLAREDFATLARRFSEDPGSREQGGDLGFFRRHEMVREFANVAFALRPGEVSPPIRTRYGYHIIKTERVRGAEVQARHILIAHEVTPSDAARARARADTVATQLRSGADAAALARQFGNADEQLRVGPLPLEFAREQLGVDFTGANVGDIMGPTPVGPGDVAAQFRVLRVVEREPPRAWTLDDPQLRENLRQRIQQDKQMEEIVAELRRRTFVDIRELR